MIDFHCIIRIRILLWKIFVDRVVDATERHARDGGHCFGVAADGLDRGVAAGAGDGGAGAGDGGAGAGDGVADAGANGASGAEGQDAEDDDADDCLFHGCRSFFSKYR